MNETLSKSSRQAILGSKKIVVLLIDDQAIVGEAVKRMLAGESDITLRYCGDPSQAISIANEIAPTVILQDLVMPDVDGMTLVKFFRRNPQTKDVPLIVLSSKEEPKTKAEAFSIGANDYLVKLPDKIELIARIRHHSAGYINMLERDEAFIALQESQKALAAELAEAAAYVSSILPKKMEGDIRTDWKFVSSTSLGGDAFGYHWLDENSFAMYLLDVCGHGVGAALLSISVMEVLRSRNLPNTNFADPSSVLRRLNDEFQMEDHNQLIFTIWYGVFMKRERKIVYSSGGHPPALLISGKNSEETKLRELAVSAPMIGAFSDIEFPNGEADLEEFNRLFIFSDGAYEISRPNLPDWSLDEFEEYVFSNSKKAGFGVEAIHSEVRSLHGSASLDDDFSIVDISIAF